MPVLCKIVKMIHIVIYLIDRFSCFRVSALILIGMFKDDDDEGTIPSPGLIH